MADETEKENGSEDQVETTTAPPTTDPEQELSETDQKIDEFYQGLDYHRQQGTLPEDLPDQETFRAAFKNPRYRKQMHNWLLMQQSQGKVSDIPSHYRKFNNHFFPQPEEPGPDEVEKNEYGEIVVNGMVAPQTPEPFDQNELTGRIRRIAEGDIEALENLNDLQTAQLAEELGIEKERLSKEINRFYPPVPGAAPVYPTEEDRVKDEQRQEVQRAQNILKRRMRDESSRTYLQKVANNTGDLLTAGTLSLGASVVAAKEMLTDAPEAQRRLTDTRRRMQQKIQSYSEGVAPVNFTEIGSKDGYVADAARWTTSQLVGAIPSVGSIMAGGYLGGKAGAPLGKPGMIAGSLIGSFSAAFTQMSGALYGDLIDMGADPDNAKRHALLYAAPAAGVEMIVPGLAASAILGAMGKNYTKKRIKEVLIGAGISTPFDGLAGGISEAMMIAAEIDALGKEYTREEIADRIINSAAVEALAGLGAGAIGGAGRKKGSVDGYIDGFLNSVEAIAEPIPEMEWVRQQTEFEWNPDASPSTQIDQLTAERKRLAKQMKAKDISVQDKTNIGYAVEVIDEQIHELKGGQKTEKAYKLVNRPVVLNHLRRQLLVLEQDRGLTDTQRQLLDFLDDAEGATSNPAMKENVRITDEIIVKVDQRTNQQNLERLTELNELAEAKESTFEEQLEMSAIIFNRPSVFKAFSNGTEIEGENKVTPSPGVPTNDQDGPSLKSTPVGDRPVVQVRGPEGELTDASMFGDEGSVINRISDIIDQSESVEAALEEMNQQGFEFSETDASRIADFIQERQEGRQEATFGEWWESFLSESETSQGITQQELEDNITRLKDERAALRGEDGTVPPENMEQWNALGEELLEAQELADRGNNTGQITIKSKPKTAEENPQILVGDEAVLAEKTIEAIIQRGIKEGQSATDIVESIGRRFTFLDNEFSRLKKYVRDRIDKNLPEVGNNKSSFASWRRGETDVTTDPATDESTEGTSSLFGQRQEESQQKRTSVLQQGTLADVTGQRVTYGEYQGVLRTDPEGNFVVETNDGTIVEVADSMKDPSKNISELGLERSRAQLRNMRLNDFDSGSFTLEETNPETGEVSSESFTFEASNTNEAGEVVSVTMRNAEGQQRVFRQPEIVEQVIWQNYFSQAENVQSDLEGELSGQTTPEQAPEGQGPTETITSPDDLPSYTLDDGDPRLDTVFDKFEAGEKLTQPEQEAALDWASEKIDELTQANPNNLADLLDQLEQFENEVITNEPQQTPDLGDESTTTPEDAVPEPGPGTEATPTGTTTTTVRPTESGGSGRPAGDAGATGRPAPEPPGPRINGEPEPPPSTEQPVTVEQALEAAPIEMQSLDEYLSRVHNELDELFQQNPASANRVINELKKQHKQFIAQAIEDGQAVPESALKGYPDLAKKMAIDESSTAPEETKPVRPVTQLTREYVRLQLQQQVDAGNITQQTRQEPESGGPDTGEGSQGEILSQLAPEKVTNEVIDKSTSEPKQQLLMAGYLPKIVNNLRKKGPKTKEIVSRQDITNHIIEKFKVAVNVGRSRGLLNALGFYRLRPYGHAIRLRVANDISVLAHEVGHYLHDVLFDAGTHSKFDRELMPLGARTSREDYSPDQIRMEGQAEFFRYLITDQDTAKRLAPSYFDFFAEAVNKDPLIRRAVDEVTAMISGYVSQDGPTRLRSQIAYDDQSPTKTAPQEETVPQYLYRMILDDLIPLQRAREELLTERNEIDSEQISTDAFRLAQLAKGIPALIQGWMEFGVRNTAGQKIHKGLAPILREAGIKTSADRRNFEDYLVSRRSIELYEQAERGERELAGDHGQEGGALGISKQDAEETFAKFNSPQFEKAAQEIYGWTEATLEWVVERGYMNREQVDAMLEMNQNYIPMHRVMDHLDAKAAGKKSSMVNKPTLWQKIRGSGRRILPPLTTLVRNTQRMVQIAEQNYAAVQMFEDIRSAKKGGVFADQTSRQFKPVKGKLSDIKKALEEAGIDQDLIEELDLETSFTLFQPLGHNPAKREVMIRRNGKPEIWQVHNDALYDTLVANSPKTNRALSKILTGPKNVFRTGVIISLNFVMSALQRDQFVAFAQSRYGYAFVHLNPFKEDFGSSDYFKGMMAILRNSEEYQLWLQSRAGISGIVDVGGSADQVGRTLDNLQQNDIQRIAKNIIFPTRWLQGLEAFSALTENSTRVGEFMRGIQIEGRDEEGLMRAAISSREIAADYARGGQWAKALGRYKAFLNAGLQGDLSMAQAIKRDPVGFALRGVYSMALPTLALNYAMAENEDYMEREEERRAYWLFPMGDPRTTTEWFKVRKPWRLGSFFGTIFPEALEIASGTNDGTILQDMFPAPEDALSVAMDLLPSAVLPLLEVQYNYNSFFQRNIDPYYELQLEPYLRYDDRNSEVEKQLGKVLNMSPRRIRHLIRGFAGTIGVDASDLSGEMLADIMQRPEDPPLPDTDPVQDIPGLQVFFSKDISAGRSKSFQQFYKLLDQSRTKRRSYTSQRGTPEGQAYLEENQALINLNPTLERINRRISDIRDSVERVYLSQSMTPEEKRDALRGLNSDIIELSRQAVRQFEGQVGTGSRTFSPIPQ